ncbi:hypothetical protein [Bacillus manliponensis]|uniref:hypothetical protein n=1 Tax=Bacillus manliponensis TaxID=574376 RepID=UPI0035115A5F
MDRTLFQKQIHILQDAKGIKELSKGFSEDMMERLYIVLDDHQNFELVQPKWFQREALLKL